MQQVWLESYLLYFLVTFALFCLSDTYFSPWLTGLFELLPLFSSFDCLPLTLVILASISLLYYIFNIFAIFQQATYSLSVASWNILIYIYIYNWEKCLSGCLLEPFSRQNYSIYQENLFHKPLMNLLGLCHRRIHFDLRGQPRPLEAILDFVLKKVVERSGILKILITDQIFLK